MKSDTNTGRFTLSLGMSVEFYSDTTKIGAAEYPGTDMRHIVPALIPLLAKKGATNITDKIARGLVLPSTTEAGTGAILQNWFWPRMAAWFRDGDVLLGDMGTSAFGMLPMALPSDCQYHTQCMWGAIGWSVGAALGAAFAANEVGMKRTVLFVGDGSLQLVSTDTSSLTPDRPRDRHHGPPRPHPLYFCYQQ
jgi:pyruvate decarboxylase